MHAILRNRKATAGAVILLMMVFVAAFPGLIAPDDPQAAIYGQNLGPSWRTCSARLSSARTFSRSSSGARGSR